MTNNAVNGAEILVRTLLDGGIDTCFANPGTSEMHFVAALDRHPEMRCVLGLHETVVTGAADGYFRIAGRPAATLLHLGPGFANGLSNLHNAQKAGSGVVNVVGDHASWHLAFDAPLTSDLDGLARPLSALLRRAESADTVGRDTAEAIGFAAQVPGRIATLILPGDAAWDETTTEAGVVTPATTETRVDEDALAAAVAALRSGRPTLILANGPAIRGAALDDLGRVMAATGARGATPTFAAVIERGAGRVALERLPYPVEQAIAWLKPFETIILIGCDDPVGFFAYPGKPSRLADPAATVISLASRETDGRPALARLVEALDLVEGPVPRRERQTGPLPEGPLTPDGIARVLAALMPDDAIVVDESITGGLGSYPLTASAAPHAWLQNMGGSIGFAPPVATGAAIAAPGRTVLCLTGDGSAMYSPQALWTQAREKLKVVTLVFANRSYNILKMEFAGVGAGLPGPSARAMMEIDRPVIDFVRLGESMGVPSERVDTAEALAAAFARALAAEGPSLIEAVI